MSIHSFCPECGINVKVDEDGCCAACGATATGSALKDIVPRARVAELERRIRAARKALRYPGTQTRFEVGEALDLRKPLPKRGRP